MPGVVVGGRILIKIQSLVINLNRAPSEKQNANVFEKKSVLTKGYLKFRLRVRAPGRGLSLLSSDTSTQ